MADREVIEIGSTSLKFYLTPGHTPGALSTEYLVYDDGRPYRALTPGGLDLNVEVSRSSPRHRKALALRGTGGHVVVWPGVCAAAAADPMSRLWSQTYEWSAELVRVDVYRKTLPVRSWILGQDNLVPRLKSFAVAERVVVAWSGAFEHASGIRDVVPRDAGVAVSGRFQLPAAFVAADTVGPRSYLTFTVPLSAGGGGDRPPRAWRVDHGNRTAYSPRGVREYCCDHAVRPPPRDARRHLMVTVIQTNVLHLLSRVTPTDHHDDHPHAEK